MFLATLPRYGYGTSTR
ncbi:hypothetical protein A2U01_0112543, partial [Trifolium medium]|nr:hypothetical protein [Trifolium medium]